MNRQVELLRQAGQCHDSILQLIQMGEMFNQWWEELAEFIFHRNSIDIGALNSMLLTIHSDTVILQPTFFAGQVATFLQAVSTHCRTKPPIFQGEALALMALDSLIYNIYRIVRGNEHFRPNNSSFYGWMSMSQLSGEISEPGNSNPEKDTKKVVALIEALTNSQAVFKRLRAILDRNVNRERNQRYAQTLMETMDYILNKQKCSRENYLKLRSKYMSNNSIYPNRKSDTKFKAINEVLFSNQLNKVLNLLSVAPDEVHLAVIRIYWSGRESMERKQFQGSAFTSWEMTYNLHRYYIESFDDMSDLFEEGKHPLFRFIRNELLHFVPFFRLFHRCVARLGQNGDEPSEYLFYKGKEAVLESELLQLINKMPLQLLQLLNSLYSILQERHKEKDQAVNLVKKLFFYSFLLSPALIQQLTPQVDPNRYSHTYNHVLLLFFRTSTKKLAQLTSAQMTLVSRLIDTVTNHIDSRIITPEQPVLQNSINDDHDTLSFIISEPILNHDYELVEEELAKLEFTPKDEKIFHMRRQGEQQPKLQSPLYKHFKKEISGLEINSQQLLPDQQIDLITWMSVGGVRQYDKQPHPHNLRRKPMAERLAGLSTLPHSKRRELQSMLHEISSLL